MDNTTAAKITKRDVLTTLVKAIDAGDIMLDAYDVSAEDVKAYAENEIALLDKRAVKAKERAEKNKAESDELTEVVYETLTDEFEPIANILSRIEGEDLSAAKVVARMRKLVDAGRAEKAELKVKPAEGGRARSIMGYKRA